MNILKVISIIQTEFAVAPEDGDILKNEISKYLPYQEVVLDFEGITRATTLFFNHATAPFLRTKSLEEIKNYIKLTNTTKSIDILYAKVMVLANLKPNKPEEYKKLMEEE